MKANKTKKLNRSKIKQLFIIFLVVVMLLGGAAPIILQITNAVGLEKEISKITPEGIDVMEQIWVEIEQACQRWENGEITREELAQIGIELNEQLKGITLPEESQHLIQKTEVMLFDMARGIEIENNEHAGAEKIEEETLKYVYGKRKASVDNLIEHYKGE